MRVHILWGIYCQFCSKVNAIVWQGDCGCWAFKCLLCGEVDHLDCGDEEPDHWDDFEYEAERLT